MCNKKNYVLGWSGLILGWGGGGTTKETISMFNSRSPEAGILKFEININFY